MNIKRLLEELVALGASDLHLKPGLPPVVRQHGRLQRLNYPAPTPKDLEEVARQILTPLQRERFENTKEVDFAFGVAGLARFRANCYVQRNTVAMVFRHVPVTIPTVEDLALPAVLGEIALKPRGLVIVTGVTGSGKSTTLASLVKQINRHLSSVIITIEDPIEFLHRDERSVVNQREVGSDTASYHEALRHVLRQDPDVILIGEIRDKETMEIALKAADTGHLVLTTLHTVDAMQTVHRVISFFPPHQHQEVRYLLASTLQAVISQRLLTRAEGNGLVPAVEVMLATGTIRECIVNPEKTPLITQTIREGVVQHKMQTFDQALMKLYQDGTVTLEDALRASTNPHELMLRLKGIEATADKTWDNFEAVPQTSAAPEI